MLKLENTHNIPTEVRSWDLIQLSCEGVRHLNTRAVLTASQDQPELKAGVKRQSWGLNSGPVMRHSDVLAAWANACL